MMRKIFIQAVPHAWLLVGVLVWLLGTSTPAHAHAQLVRATPAPGSVLAQAPAEIRLDFSEALDASFSRVSVVDATGATVVAGPGAIPGAQPQTLQVVLPALPAGTYSAVWRARSAVDGHTTTGVVAFAIGVTNQAVSQLPPPGTPDPATMLPTPSDTLTRWASYLSATVLAGCPLFAVLVWGPASRRRTAQPGAGDVTGILRRLLCAAGIAGMIATVGTIIGQATEAADGPVTGATLGAVLGGRTGLLLLARLGLLALLLSMTWWLHSLHPRMRRRWWLAAAVGSGVLVTFSVQGHSAARGDWLGVVLDWVHLVAMAAWLGGLVPLVMVLWWARTDRALLRVVVACFSGVALVSVATLTLTGLYLAWVQVGSLQALLPTTYGRALLVKLGLFALLIGLGALNLLVLAPHLGWRSGRSLRRTVGVELAVGSVLLLAVGVLTGVAPAGTALDLQHQQGVIGTIRQQGVDFMLRVAPQQIGDNEFGVDVLDRRVGAVTVPAQVVLRVTMAGHSMGTTEVATTTTDGRRYTARGSYLAMAGPWQIEVIVRRAGFDDVRHTFVVPLDGTAMPHDH